MYQYCNMLYLTYSTGTGSCLLDKAYYSTGTGSCLLDKAYYSTSTCSWLPMTRRMLHYLFSKKGVDVNEHERLSIYTLKIQIIVKEQHFYCCSTFLEYNPISKWTSSVRWWRPFICVLGASEVEKKFVIKRNHTPSPDKEMIGP
jgi:hypothetical protein